MDREAPRARVHGVTKSSKDASEWLILLLLPVSLIFFRSKNKHYTFLKIDFRLNILQNYIKPIILPLALGKWDERRRTECKETDWLLLLFCLQSHVWLCDPTDCSTPGFPVLHISWSLLKLMSIESVVISNHLIPCHLLLFLPSVFPRIRVFSSDSATSNWLMYNEF